MPRSSKFISLIVAIVALQLTACNKKQTYTCQCYGGVTGGPTETIQVASDSRNNAATQCAAMAEPPTNTRNSCMPQ